MSESLEFAAAVSELDVFVVPEDVVTVDDGVVFDVVPAGFFLPILPNLILPVASCAYFESFS